MTVTVIEGDCRAVLATLPAESFDCIIADPPYGETSLAWDRWPEGWPAAVRRVLKRAGSMWVFGSMRMFLGHIEEIDGAGWRFAQDVVWEKHNGSSFHADRFKRVHESALQFYRDDAPWDGVYREPQFTDDATKRTLRRKRRPAHMGHIEASAYRSEGGGPRLVRSVIYAASEHGKAVHPTQKPLAIVAPLVRYSCPPGGSILDPFAGSGTTAIVARVEGMDCTLIEANAEFLPIIRARIEGDAPMLALP